MMKGKTNLVYVNTFFETGEKLFNTLRKYAKSSDEHFVYWDEFAFTVDDPDACDALLIFNNPGKEIITETDPGKVIAFMMEPGLKSVHPWMFENLDQYSKIYSPLSASVNSIPSHGFLGWNPDYSWKSLSELETPAKTDIISCISSDLNSLKGHKLRNEFISILKKEIPEIHYYGKGSNFLEDKFDGLIPYTYSIAIENTSINHYFTEKINDCFLAWSVPLYYGCRNIDKYFPERSFIRIDINDRSSAIKKIRSIIDNDDPAARTGALMEARDLVLNKYQPLAGVVQILRELPISERERVSLKPVRANIMKKARSVFKDIKQKLFNTPV